MLKLTRKYYEHSRGIYYSDWDKELLKALLEHRPVWNNGVTEFYISVDRCTYELLFSNKDGNFLGSKQFFKTTKTSIGELVLPALELVASLMANGYMELESEE